MPYFAPIPRTAFYPDRIAGRRVSWLDSVTWTDPPRGNHKPQARSVMRRAWLGNTVDAIPGTDGRCLLGGAGDAFAVYVAVQGDDTETRDRIRHEVEKAVLAAAEL